jgi:type VII secretion integral membrane protein EccD
VDLALPEDVPLADLLPTILRYAGEDLADAGSPHGGWTLARLGAPPLDTSCTPTQLALHDGEQLHFRPYAEAAPEAVFDDVVDAIATANRSRPNRWTPQLSRVVALSVALGAAVLGAVACAFIGPPQRPGALTALAIAAVLLVVALVLSRAVADARTGAPVGAAALPYAFVGGLLLLAGTRPLHLLTAPHLLVAFVLTTVVAVLAALAVAEHIHLFAGAAATSTLGALGALLATATPASGAAAAGIVGAIALAATPLLPMLSFRLARLPMPAVPVDAQDLKDDAETVAGERVLELSQLADRYLTGLLLATAVVSIGAQLTLVLARDLGAALLSLLIAVALMLRARVFAGTRQRLPLLTAGLVGLALLALAGMTAGSGTAGPAAVLGGLLVAAAGSLGYGLAVAGRRVSPLWGRLLDIVEVAAVVAVVPLLLLVLGVVGYVRGLAG